MPSSVEKRRIQGKDYYIRNKERMLERDKVYRKRNRQKCYEYLIKWKYNITFEQFLEKINNQAGKCKICEVPLTFGRGKSSACIDHDHKCCPSKRSCGKCIRGIICSSCNKLLGLSYDDITILRKAILYLNGDSCSVE